MGFTSQLNFFADAGAQTKAFPLKLGWQFAEANVLPFVQFQRNYLFPPYSALDSACYERVLQGDGLRSF